MEWITHPTLTTTRGNDCIWPVEHPTLHRVVFMAARGGTWLPGCYASVGAAKEAFDYPRFYLDGIYKDLGHPLTFGEIIGNNSPTP